MVICTFFCCFFPLPDALFFHLNTKHNIPPVTFHKHTHTYTHVEQREYMEMKNAKLAEQHEEGRQAM